MFLLIIVATIVCALVSLWIYGRWNFGTLEKMGIPVVEHHPLIGSVKDFYKNAGVYKDVEWLKKYGPVFGVYEGRLPQVFICDAELVRLMCVADAEYFNGKRSFDFKDPIMNEMPEFLPYDKWKAVRNMTTPGFSSAKIKLMNLPMREATQDFVKTIIASIEQSGNGVLENVAIDEEIHTMLTDLITRCVFSIKINDPTNKDNVFARLVREIMVQAHSRNNVDLVMWSHTFPFLRYFLDGTAFNPKPVHEFADIFKKMMDERRKSGVRKNDVVDLALEWYDKLDTPEYKAVQITELTILCQVLVYFFAAQDQLSTVTSAMLYHLAKDPEMEAKVYEEVDAVFAKHNGKIEHEHLNELVYLNACISESLRLYPFFYRVERICTKDWSNEKFGLNIKKGTVIMFPLWAINRNPDYIDDPEKYDASRWLPENKDKLNIYASTSFGHGPRSCTGKRFAIEAFPMLAAYILKDLKFVARENSKLVHIPAGPMFAAHEKIYLDVVKRSPKHVAPSA